MAKNDPKKLTIFRSYLNLHEVVEEASSSKETIPKAKVERSMYGSA